MNERAIAAHVRAELGVQCDVEVMDRMLIVVPGGAAAGLLTAPVRAALVRCAEELGYTHVAIELTDTSCGDPAPMD